MKGVSVRLLILGALLGAAAALFPGAIFVLMGVGITCVALHLWAPERNRRFLIGVFLSGFLLRAALSLALDVGSCIAEGRPPIYLGPAEYWNLGIVDTSRKYFRIGDSDSYSQRAYCLAQYVEGNREAVVLRRIQVYGYHAYVMVMGGFYSLFGFSPISVKWFNGWIGSLHILAVFFLAKACFQSQIARWASVGVAFFPTLMLWSATNLKEPLFFLCTTLIFLLFMALRSRPGFVRRAVTLAVFFLVFWVLQDLGRKEVGFSLAACLAALFCLEKWLKRRWYALLLVLAVGVVVFLNPWVKVKEAIYLGIYRHMGYVQTESTIYWYLPERFYKSPILLSGGVLSDSDALAVLRRVPLAVTHYFLQPLPWLPGSWFGLLIPQMITWYFLLFFAMIGIAAGIRWNFWNCAFLLVTGSVWVLIGALSNANIGTLVRLRDMVTPMVLVFSAAGLWAWARGRTGFAEEPAQ